MIYYANPRFGDVNDAMSAGKLGCINTPRQGNIVFPDEWEMIADNGCFSARWEHHYWLRWVMDIPRRYRFTVAPDVFRHDGAPCHAETYERWLRYGGMLERMGHTPAFVIQNGCTPELMPDAPAFFVGGDNAFKLGPVAAACVAEGRRRGAWCHMGRVNSLKRMRYASSIGCQSVDGTFIKYGPEKNLPQLLRWLETVNAEEAQRDSAA